MPRPAGLRTIALALLLVPVLGTAVRAQLHEWRLGDRALHDRASAALERYYAVIRADSLRLRYIRSNAALLDYKLRGLPSANDARGQLVSISLGQLTLFPEANVRIALGDDLYNALLDTRTFSGLDEREIANDPFGHADWAGERRMIVALDRIDVRLTPTMGLVAALGAPESNLYWWTDGTARVGLTAPGWEIGALVPISGGLTPIGPFRERRLAPAWGASGTGTIGPITAHARFATASDVAFDAYSASLDRYVHTVSAQLRYRTSTETTIGTIEFGGGIGHEEFEQIERLGDSVRARGHVRRLSPIVDLTWTNAERTLRLGVTYVDLAPRLGFSARLTQTLAIEADLTCAGLFREQKPFEHPFYLFITPRVRF